MRNKILEQFDEPHEIAGWIGTVLILAAYILVSFEFLTPQSGLYQVMNIIGALCIGYLTWVKKAYPSVVLNSIWAIIGIIALIQITTL